MIRLRSPSLGRGVPVVGVMVFASSCRCSSSLMTHHHHHHHNNNNKKKKKINMKAARRDDFSNRIVFLQQHQQQQQQRPTSTSTTLTQTTTKDWKMNFPLALYLNPWESSLSTLSPISSLSPISTIVLEPKPLDYASKHLWQLLQELYLYQNERNHHDSTVTTEVITTARCNRVLEQLLQVSLQQQQQQQQRTTQSNLQQRARAQRADCILQCMILLHDQQQQRQQQKQKQKQSLRSAAAVIPLPDASTYNLTLRILAQTAGPADEIARRCHAIVADMERRYHQQYQPTTTTTDMLLQEAQQQQQPEHEQLFLLQQQLLKPTPFHYNCVLQAWEKATDCTTTKAALALELLLHNRRREQSQHQSQSPPPTTTTTTTTTGPLTDVSSYIIVLRICAAILPPPSSAATAAATATNAIMAKEMERQRAAGAPVAVRLWQELFGTPTTLPTATAATTTTTGQSHANQNGVGDGNNIGNDENDVHDNEDHNWDDTPTTTTTTRTRTHTNSLDFPSILYVHFLQAFRALPEQTVKQRQYRNAYFAAGLQQACRAGKVNPFVLQEFLVHAHSKDLFLRFFGPYAAAIRGMSAPQASRALYEQYIPYAWKSRTVELQPSQSQPSQSPQ